MISQSVVHTPRTVDRRNRTFVIRALVASSAGTTIDYCDFTLYNVAAAIYFGKLFFPGHDPFVSTLSAFATLVPGYLVRPVGAAVFGHLGDRVGRKAMLIATLVMMAVASFGIGLVPTYAQIGVWGAVLLVLLRVVQGVGVSGEWGGAVLLGVEWQGTENSRGLAGAWAQIGLPAGTLLAYLSLYGSTALLGDDSYWGWRVPFLASAVLVLVGLYVRLGVLETPAFTRVLEGREMVPWPILTTLRQEWRPLILCFLLNAGFTAISPIFTTFVLSYAAIVLGMPHDEILLFVLVASGVSVCSVLFWGRVSDTFGRKRTYVFGTLVAMAFALPYWWLLDSRAAVLVLAAVVLSMVVRDMQYGPMAAFMAEAFPVQVRYTGAGMGYNLGSALVSGATPSIALAMFHASHTSTAIGLYMIAGTCLGFVGALLLQDRSRERIGGQAEAG